MQGKLWDTGKKCGQIAAHRQTGAETGDDSPGDGLQNADPAAGEAQLDVICPQRGGETAAEHADDHHAVDTGERGALEMNEFIVAPLFAVHADELQQLPTPAGEFAGDGPEGAGNAEVVG